MKDIISAFMVILIIVSTFTLAFSIQRAETELLPLTVSEESSTLQNSADLTSGEPPGIEWNQTYGGVGRDAANDLVQTNDGGYALAGYTWSFGALDGDFYLVKTDASGNKQWNRTYVGTDYDDRIQALVQTDDGGYAIVGAPTYGGSYGCRLVKTNASGSAQWSRTYGGTDIDGASSVVQTSDGGYAIAAHKEVPGLYNDDWLVRTDAVGNHLWNKTYGGAYGDYVFALVQTSDGGYALAGGTGSYGSVGASDFWLVKTDSLGNHLWNKTYGGTDWDWALALVQTSDGGYALTGYTYSFGAGVENIWLIKTDSLGNHLWNKTYGGTDQEFANDLVQTNDGGYALAGCTLSFGAGGWDFWLVKTDATGNMEWNQTYGGTGHDYATALVQASEDVYVLAGYTASFGAGDYDFYLIKLAPQVSTQVQGIDVSHYQGMVDWPQVYDAGYRFAFVKASEGFGLEDPLFTVNMDNGSAAGLLMGAYHLGRPDLGYGGVEEAVSFLAFARNYTKEGYLRPVLRLSTGSSLGIDELSEWVIRWMNTVRDNAFVEPVLQVTSEYANFHLNTSIAQYDLWITDWTYDTTASPDTGMWSDWAFWQYSNLGSVSGISGNVFLDIFNGNHDELCRDFVLMPDLSVSVDWVSNQHPSEGEPVTIRVKVINNGNMPSNQTCHLKFTENVEYTYPINEPYGPSDLSDTEFGSIKPYESEYFELTWYAVEIVNVDQTKRLSVTANPKTRAKDANPEDNIVYINLALDDRSGFNMSQHSFSFSNLDINPDLYFDEVNDRLEEYLSGSYSPTVSLASVNLIRAKLLGGGLCHGMARASIYYYKFPNTKPVAGNAFDMLKEEITSDIIHHSELPNFVSTYSDYMANAMELSSEYAKIVENIDRDQPVIMRITYSDQTGKHWHSVTIFNYYSESENIKNIVVYDNNLPGLSYVVTFDLQNNVAYSRAPTIWRVDYDHIYIHVPGGLQRAKKATNDFFKSLRDEAKRISIFNSPVNITIVDEYGRKISETDNQIPGAEFEHYNKTHTKIFYLPLNLSYIVYINATDNGNCTISQITPTESVYETDFSVTTFNLTVQTSAVFHLEQYNASYTLKIDEDGDSIIDYELTPEKTILNFEYDIGILETSIPKTIIGQGYSIPLNMTVINYGAYNELFNVTIYANTTLISNQTHTLASDNSTIITLTWNTAGFAKGNYTISALADPISGETCIVDNTLIGGWVMVTIPGDVNGDRDVDIFDIVRVTTRYQMTYPHPNWDPNTDIIENGKIDIFDIVAACSHYGESW